MNGMEQKVGQLVELLKQGISPKELLAQGVPEELLQQAMAILAQEAAPQPAPEGLAGMHMQPGM